MDPHSVPLRLTWSPLDRTRSHWVALDLYSVSPSQYLDIYFPLIWLLPFSERSGEYALACEHAHSCCILLARTDKFRVGGVWHTWIDYDKFQKLVQEGRCSAKKVTCVT